MTLQQEIVEALRDAALDYRAQVLACYSGLMPRRFKDEMVNRAVQYEQLAARVENARCETCACRESDIGFCGELEIVVRNGFCCWNYQEKVSK